jgi:hypothetical protein
MTRIKAGQRAVLSVWFVVKDKDPQIAPIPQIFEFKSAKSA